MDSSWNPALFAQVSFRKREHARENGERKRLGGSHLLLQTDHNTIQCISFVHSQLFLAEPTLLSFFSKHLGSIYPTPGPEAGPERSREGLFSSKIHNLPVKTEIQKKKNSESYNQYLPSSLFRIIWKYRLVSNEDPSVPKTLSFLSRGFHFDGETRNASASLKAIFGEGQVYN